MIRITSYLLTSDWGRVVGVGFQPMPTTAAKFFEAVVYKLRQCVAIRFSVSALFCSCQFIYTKLRDKQFCIFKLPETLRAE